MSADNSVSIIQDGTFIKGTVSSRGRLEIHGHIEGDVVGDQVLVHPSGNIYGKLAAQNTHIDGVVQGELQIKELLAISPTGTALGVIEYGRLKMDQGGTLSAELRNIPPELGGDLNLTVQKGRSTTITGRDLTAIDPDNTADELTYAVTNIASGYISLAHAPASPITAFTQADINAGIVNFTHDNSAADKAAFNVVVTDAGGATSGDAQTVTVAVI